jgi:Domain of unknown function (DUF6285)
MYDRPNAVELLDAVRGHLETHVIPSVKHDGKLYFQTLVAINVLRVVERELQLAPDHTQSEWARLDHLEGVRAMPSDLRAVSSVLHERNTQLCEHIRVGRYDSEERLNLFEHLMASTIEQLHVANPKFLQMLVQEDGVE